MKQKSNNCLIYKKIIKQNPLSFLALEDSYIKITIHYDQFFYDEVVFPSALYSYNNKNYNEYSLNQILQVKKGNTIYFKSNSFSKDTDYYYSFEMSGLFSGNGYINSLINYKDIVPSCCFYHIFENCSSLLTSPIFSPTILNQSCYEGAFYNCYNLQQQPYLNSIDLANRCYEEMFYGCSSLKKAKYLPASKVKFGCYRSMYANCSSLIQCMNQLPAKNLKQGNTGSYPGGQCYNGMFQNCKSLSTIPYLPATILSYSCYMGMFAGCDSLTSINYCFPAYSAERQSFNSIFSRCKNLKYVPQELFSNVITGSPSYAGAFYNCSSLISAAKIPKAPNYINGQIFHNMYKGCINLIYQKPELLNTNLNWGLYTNLFTGCKNINYLKVHFTQWLSGRNYYSTQSWLSGCSPTGTFVCPKELDTSYRSYSTIPQGWTIETF